jgi:hypothetical protein
MSRKKEQHVAVLTADIIQSTHYSRLERQRLNRALLKAFDEVVRRYPKAVHTRLAFRITAGDEFQCVFSEIAKSFDILTYLRAMLAMSGLEPVVRIRASIGVGEISVAGGSSYEEDGEAFVRSRRGLEQLEGGKHNRFTKILTNQPDLDSTADVVLTFLDYLQQGWTVPQWEAVGWGLLDLTREKIAKKLKVRHQNVSKRLSAAGWRQFRIGAAFLRELLDRVSDP